ncbi:restriction endonuclease PLD domain-containing protein [Desulfovibrio sp.]|uniref:restriction endonuclease PLD domain-containing protein n=1 Tax=Desulfovibrio sp. TaxID=885 RepID=UPI0025C5B71A|nr:restriction endonuclease PLD domain-containing protein [Desulfovibrio sp.]
MKILSGKEIQKAVHSCKPSRVAVAFIGRDWNTFIPDAQNLQTVIVSPTLGSNPDAITDIAKQLGWNKIYFLNELHAKIYIGEESAVVGSANLTQNGLSGEGLVELCVELSCEKNLHELCRFFDGLKAQAQEQYPTEISKLAQLKKLKTAWNSAFVNNITSDKHSTVCSFADFELLGDDDFYVVWYQPEPATYSEEVESIRADMNNDMHFASDDRVEKDHWALIWRYSDNSGAPRAMKPEWMYIHEIFENGVIDEEYEYTKCAIERKIKKPIPPFELTSDVKAAFKKAVVDKDIAKYMIQKGVFRLETAKKGLPLLISRMKKYLEQDKDSATS